MSTQSPQKNKRLTSRQLDRKSGQEGERGFKDVAEKAPNEGNEPYPGAAKLEDASWTESDYQQAVRKYKNSLEDLEKIAKEQENQLNLSMLYIATECALQDEPYLRQYFDSRGIRILTEDVEPDGVSHDASGGAENAERQVNPFNPTQIDIKVSMMIMGKIISRMEYGELDFASEFQRKAGLWSDKQKSRLIESMFLNIPLPSFYFDASDKNKWVIIDGLQRLSAVREFVVDKTLTLSEMEFLHDLNGKKYDQIPRSLQRRIDETDITAYIVNPATPPNVKYNIFKRINTGGLILEAQEIRNALFQGNSTRYLKEMSLCEEFLRATGQSVSGDRMLDREFCLRYVAFTEFPLKDYRGNLDEWLNDAMIYLNRKSESEFQEILSCFREVMDYCWRLFEKYAFRKMAWDRRRRPINKALFEGWSRIVKTMPDAQRTELLNRKQSLWRNFIRLCDGYVFQSYLRSSDRTSVTERIKLLERAVSDAIAGKERS